MFITLTSTYDGPPVSMNININNIGVFYKDFVYGKTVVYISGIQFFVEENEQEIKDKIEETRRNNLIYEIMNNKVGSGVNG